MRVSIVIGSDKFPSKTALTIVLFAILLAVLPVFPRLRRLGGLHPDQLGRLVRLPVPVRTRVATAVGSNAKVALPARPAAAEPEPGWAEP